MVKIAIIGGSGHILEHGFEIIKEVKISTPYGNPSDSIFIGKVKNTEIAVLPRHGRNHTIPPHKINFRANIWALKEMGVERIIATAAVGSLKKDYMPGDIVFPNQFIDFGKDVTTFYDRKRVYHVSLADPFCPTLREVLIKVAKKLKLRYHEKATYLRISGPRFSTRAESKMFRRFAEIIGMTCVQEAILAREAEICFAVIASVTDYDVWAEKPVSAKEVIEVMRRNKSVVEKILLNSIESIPSKRTCPCKDALKNAAIG
ncbi:MAG TPA: S-methyl-5'-thioadenosine phosphorylase [Candidatus Aenigmarchaeota archaeon]|nr:MAG: S-methyl-5'-thioadenosine phosphorylase [Candidatus Aenigmarchaeota archaeon]HDD46115.1 S-methyl-5'-thioadenosine phosphorylase [Candidatus Aenigmarchaeota archaeon]